MTGRLDSSTAQTSCKSAAEGCTPTSCEGGGEGPSVQGNSPLMVNERDSGRGRWVQSERREAGYGGARGRACSVGPGHASTCSWPGVRGAGGPPDAAGLGPGAPDMAAPAHLVLSLSVCTDCVYLYVYCLCALTVSTSMCTVCVHCLCVLLCVLSCLCVLSSVWQRA
jgi:hypothetical protein